MQNVLKFRDSIIDYLTRQKELEQADIEKNKLLTEEQKIEKGLLIKDALVISNIDQIFEIRTYEDNTKLKIGDTVVISRCDETGNAKIIDTGINSISFETALPLQIHDNISIEIVEGIYIDPFISLLQNIDEGKPGISFLKQLAGIEMPSTRNFGSIDINTIFSIPDSFNKSQLEVISDSLQRPSTYCIQGPPGTGKTAVLAAIANCFSEKRKDVLIISNTHQAVNNALDKIAQLNSDAYPIKIGQILKLKNKRSNISVCETYVDYLKLRKKQNKKRVMGDIVGMTLHSAVINVGLRNSGFQPQIVLVDEAGQMSMSYASVIGAFGCGSIIFIGDDKQMPPIFHPQLINNAFSQSIFSFVCNLYPQLRKTLNITYRMNNDITAFVNKHFYESKDASQRIYASKYSSERIFPIQIGTEESPEVLTLLTSKESISYCDVSTSESYLDENPDEARMAFMLSKAAIKNGLHPSDIAIITPFRKQVKMIRSIFYNEGWNSKQIPLINTVECLQGQDVEFIIISYAVTNFDYLKEHYDFIMDPHRLNVMVSRAKTKVVFLVSKTVKEMILEI